MFWKSSNGEGRFRKEGPGLRVIKGVSAGAMVAALVGSLSFSTLSPAFADEEDTADLDIQVTDQQESDLETTTGESDTDPLDETTLEDALEELLEQDLIPEAEIDDPLLESVEALSLLDALGNFAPTVSPLITPTAVSPERILYEEDFEPGMPNAPIELEDLNRSGVRYSADTYWLDSQFCNGFITRSSLELTERDIFNTYCGMNGGQPLGDYQAVRAKAYQLGITAGQTPAQAENNHALSTNTSGGTPTDVMFETTETIPLSIPGEAEKRFIAFSVDSAETGNGEIALPQMQFWLLQNGQATNLNPTPIPGANGTAFNLDSKFPEFPDWAQKGTAGRFYSDPFIIDGARTVGLRLTNTSRASSQGCGAYRNANSSGLKNGSCLNGYSGSSNGNDGAIDNIRIVDVTPVMEKAFNPEIQSVGRESTMTLTIKNADDKGKKDGWSFVDTLPDNLIFANDTVTVSGQCSATATIDKNAGTLTVDNGVLNSGADECVISAQVTSTDVATYTNGKPNGNFSNIVGFDGPENAEVEFYEGSVAWDKVDASNEMHLAGSTWMFEGPEEATTSTPVGGWPVGNVEDCIEDAVEDCTGLDKNPEAGKFLIEGLPSGKYTLTELTPPAGYIPEERSWTVEITSKETVKFNADKGGKITNSLGSAVWTKSSEDTAEFLAGSEWELRYVSGASGEIYTVTDCISTEPEGCAEQADQDGRSGHFEVIDLPTGWYELWETTAPEGYEPITELVEKLEIKQGTAQIDFGNIVNKKISSANITINKIVQDVSGNEQPGEGWNVQAALSGNNPAGVTIDPQNSQTTASDGAVAEPWTVTFLKNTSVAEVVISEQVDSKPGYEFVEARCVFNEGKETAKELIFAEYEFALSAESALKPGDTVNCTFVNKQKSGTVIWDKVDESTPAQLLEGSEWKISGPGFGPDNNVITDCISEDCGDLLDRNPAPGKFKLENLAAGDYEIIELKAPAGYKLDSTTVHKIIIGPEEPAKFDWDLGQIKNTSRDAPVIPLTGGIGRDFFSILGALVLALGAGTIGINKLRRREK